CAMPHRAGTDAANSRDPCRYRLARPNQIRPECLGARNASLPRHEFWRQSPSAFLQHHETIGAWLAARPEIEVNNRRKIDEFGSPGLARAGKTSSPSQL